MAKLKVYCTPAGFHDAYVAAPSQKAALKAWGSEANLFARGVAEQVTDPVLMKEPLAAPGQVVRKLRGTEEERRIARKPKAKASRAALDRAESALAEARTRHRAQLIELEKRQAALARERRALEKRHQAEQGRLQRAVERERERYDRKVLASG